MADFETILKDLDIPAPGEVGQEEPANENTREDVTDTSFSAMEARAERLFNPGAEKPAETKEKIPGAADNQIILDKAKETPAGTPELGFVEASKKAFLSADGQGVDTQKVSDYFLNKGKSFQQFAETAPDLTEKAGVKKEEAVLTPEQEYTKSVSEIFNTLPDILKEEAAAGFTPEQTLQRLINTVTGLTSTRDQRTELSKERERLANEFKGEVAEIREAKITSQINRNITELGSHLEGLIPGVKGGDVLNKFVLAPEYGGKMLDAMFRRDNPDFASVPEADRKAKTQEWFKNFQTNRQDLAMVAEHGRAMWMLEQLPGIISHAQTVGAAKAANTREAGAGKPSGLNAPSRGADSALSGFLGYDTVN
jgi:hypothetical protein